MAYYLRSWPNSESEEPAFYVQTVGQSAGEPMKTPSANCFAVYTDPEVLLGDYFYYLVLNAFNTGQFDRLRRGTGQPYITQGDFYSLF